MSEFCLVPKEGRDYFFCLVEFGKHQRSASFVTAAAIVLVILIAMIDRVAGPRLSFGVFFLLPVMLCAWVCPRSHRMALCVLSGLAWLMVEILWDDTFPASWFAVWSALLRFGTFVLASEVTASIASQQSILELEIAERKRVERSLRELNDTLEKRVAERTAAAEARSMELAQSEMALRRQAEDLQAILNSMGEGVIVVDADGKILMCNPEAGHLLQIEGGNGSLVDAAWLNRTGELGRASPLHPLMTRCDLPLRQAALTGDAVLNVEIGSRAADGAERIAIWSAVPLRKASGKPEGAVAVGRDITALKKVEASLLRSNVELERTVRQRAIELTERASLLELSFDAIIVRDSLDRITFWNSGAEEMYGWRREEALGKVTHDLFDSQLPKPLLEIIEELHQTGRWTGELIHKRRDGSRLTVATRWALQFDQTGNPLAILETNSDITEQRQTEEALRRKLEQEVAERTVTLEKRSAELAQSETALRRQAEVLQSILNSMGDGVIVADVHGKILLRNPEAERLLLVQNKDETFQDWLERQTTFSTVVTTDQRLKEHALIRALRGDSVDGAEMLVHQNSTSPGVWVRATIRPLIDERGELRGTVMMFSDVTVRKWLEKQVAEISEREQRRIGQDLHDGVCQHLVSTAYACNMLAERLSGRGYSEASQASEIGRSINEAILQARSLARALYPVDLTDDGLIFALEELSDKLQSGTKIACSFNCEGLASINDQGIATNLYRIAQEGINNAVKHSRSGQILLQLSVKNGVILLKIEDDGIGFQPDFAKRKGMGLDIMNYRARMIGASLDIEPRPGGGTRVTCALQNPKSDPSLIHPGIPS